MTPKPRDPNIVRMLQEHPPCEYPASPHDINFPDGVERWWRPDLAEIARYLGWRWLLILPAIAVLLLVLFCVVQPHLFQVLWWLGFKIISTLVVLPFVLAGYAIHNITRHRRDPFCIHCGYTLLGLPNHYICPECGMPYSLEVNEEFRRNPQWFIQRWRKRDQIPQRAIPFDTGPASGPRRKSSDGT